MYTYMQSVISITKTKNYSRWICVRIINIWLYVISLHYILNLPTLDWYYVLKHEKTKDSIFRIGTMK